MIGLADIQTARTTLRQHVWRTPLIRSAALSRRTGCSVHLKLECWQQTGSFKVRGAIHKLATTSATDGARGFVTASAGNHGLGLAYACQVLRLPPPTIFVPLNAPQAKLKHLEMTGCLLQHAGSDYDACHALAVNHADATGAHYISAYDDPVIIAGQATVALEILDSHQDVDLLLVPVGGGGLIAGVAIAAKASLPHLHIIGVQPEASPSAHLSLRDGRAYETYAAGPTICDGLAGGFGRIPFELAAGLIDEIVIVPEQDVRRSVAWLLAHEQIVVEGSGAIAIAPLLSGQLAKTHGKVVAILTGRNIDASLLRSILDEYGSLVP